MQDTCLAPGIYHPKSLLLQTQDFNGYLRVSNQTVEWFIYFQAGQVTYASHSVDAFERLERHIRGLSRELVQIDAEARAQVRAQFDAETQQDSPLTADYRTLAWMVEQQLIDPLLAGTLASKLTAEVFESYLLLPEMEYEVEQVERSQLPTFCSLGTESLIKRTEARLQMWQALYPRVRSPYQRPYLAGETLARQKLPAETVNSFSRLLIGFNFRQLGLVLKQDELQLAHQLSSLVAEGIIVLRDPVSPFDKLPQIQAPPSQSTASTSPPESTAKDDPSHPADLSGHDAAKPDLSGFEATAGQKVWKIMCIDDNQSMLGKINQFLKDDIFSVTLINDPKQALIQMMSIEPDLVLLDVSMPDINGYQICSMIRKSAMLKDIPVVMMTGHQGLIDRARVKMAGATDYLLKPFEQKDLLGMMLRHLEH